MADSDCSNCRYSHYSGGPCPYYEYECVFCPFFGVSESTARLMIIEARAMKTHIDRMVKLVEDNVCDIEELNMISQYAEDLCEKLSDERYKEYREMFGKGEENDGSI